MIFNFYQSFNFSTSLCDYQALFLCIERNVAFSLFLSEVYKDCLNFVPDNLFSEKEEEFASAHILYIVNQVALSTSQSMYTVMHTSHLLTALLIVHTNIAECYNKEMEQWLLRNTLYVAPILLKFDQSN